MVDEEYFKKIESYLRKSKDETEKKLNELDVKLVEEFENKSDDPLREFIQKTRVDKNPIQLKKCASDIMSSKEDYRKYLVVSRDSLKDQLHRIDDLMREIGLKRKLETSPKSFSNKRKYRQENW